MRDWSKKCYKKNSPPANTPYYSEIMNLTPQAAALEPNVFTVHLLQLSPHTTFAKLFISVAWLFAAHFFVHLSSLLYLSLSLYTPVIKTLLKFFIYFVMLFVMF